MKRTFAALMKLYPPGYRLLFADEMAAVFEDASRDQRKRGWVSYTLFLIAEFAGLLSGIALAWSLGLWQTRTFPAVYPFVAGALLTLPLLRLFLHFHRFLPAAMSHGPTQDELLELMVLATVSIVVIAGCSIAFVLNMRSLARRRQSKA